MRSDRPPVRLLLVALAAACVAPTVGPDRASAQQGLALELRAGAGLPAFDLADAADPGAALGLDLSYLVADRVSVVVGGDVEFLSGDGNVDRGGGSSPRPGLTGWHYGAGLEAQLLDPRRTYWRLSLRGGAGASTFDVADGGGSETAFSVHGGLELGHEVSTEAELFAGIRTWAAFAGDGGAVDPDGGTLWSFPVTGGVRLIF